MKPTPLLLALLLFASALFAAEYTSGWVRHETRVFATTDYTADPIAVISQRASVLAKAEKDGMRELLMEAAPLRHPQTGEFLPDGPDRPTVGFMPARDFTTMPPGRW